MQFLSDPITLNVLTALLVFITAIYAGLTHSIAKSNRVMTYQVRTQIESQTRPVISINIEIRHKTIFSLKISNRGQSPATAIYFKISQSIYQYGDFTEDRNLANIQLFNQEIPTMAPGDVFLLDLYQGFNINKMESGQNITPDRFKVTADYKFGEVSYHEIFHIDLRPYLYTRADDRETEELQRIAKILEERLKRN